MYFYRASDSVGDTVEFFSCEYRDLAAAKRFFNNVLNRHSRPDCIVLNGIRLRRVDGGKVYNVGSNSARGLIPNRHRTTTPPYVFYIVDDIRIISRIIGSQLDAYAGSN